VNRTTGVVTPWLKLDSVPVSQADRLAKLGGGANATSAIHGVAIDDAYHVLCAIASTTASQCMIRPTSF